MIGWLMTMAKVIIFQDNELVEKYIELDSPIKLRELLAKLGIPKESIGFVICKSNFAALDDLIDVDDEVRIFPPLGGG